MDNKMKSVNNLMSDYMKNFYNVYHKSIVPLFTQYELLRKRRLSVLIILSLILVSISVLLLVEVYSGEAMRRANADNIRSLAEAVLIISEFLLAIVLPALVVYMHIYFNNKFVMELKDNCMSKILAAFGNISPADDKNLISDEELAKSNLFSEYGYRSNLDSFKGVYKDVEFDISEIILKQENNTRNIRHPLMLFGGVVVRFKANKTIRNNTIIALRRDKSVKNSAPAAILLIISLFSLVFLLVDKAGGIREMLNNPVYLLTGIYTLFGVVLMFIAVLCKYKENKLLKSEALSSVKLEDPEFSRKYSAYSSDQVEGRYLITPAFMERFKNLEIAFSSGNIKCSFYDDKIMFAISTDKNLFEIGNLYHSLKDPKQMTIFFNELASILALIDYFKLDEQTGL